MIKAIKQWWDTSEVALFIQGLLIVGAMLTALPVVLAFLAWWWRIFI
jgi:hypothetical protein